MSSQWIFPLEVSGYLIAGFSFFADREEQITGVFMTAQAVAKEMIRHGRGGSIAMIASMSGSVANRVSAEIINRQSTV